MEDVLLTQNPDRKLGPMAETQVSAFERKLGGDSATEHLAQLVHLSLPRSLHPPLVLSSAKSVMTNAFSPVSSSTEWIRKGTTSSASNQRNLTVRLFLQTRRADSSLPSQKKM